MAAARQFNPKANPPILGYTYIDDNSLTDNLRRRFEKQISLREDLKIKDDTEVQLDVFRTIAKLKEPILGKFSLTNSELFFNDQFAKSTVSS